MNIMRHLWRFLIEIRNDVLWGFAFGVGLGVGVYGALVIGWMFGFLPHCPR